MVKKISKEQILDIKRHIDNGFNGVQIRDVLGFHSSTISKVSNGHYGELPKFKKDPKLSEQLCRLNRATLAARKDRWIARRELKA